MAEKKPASEKAKRVVAPDMLKAGTPGAIIKQIALGAIGLHLDKTTDKASRKKESNKLAPKWSNKTLSRLAASGSGADYDKLKSLAKAAAPDVAKNEYSSKVKDFIAFMKQYGGSGLRAAKDRSGLAALASQL